MSARLSRRLASPSALVIASLALTAACKLPFSSDSSPAPSASGSAKAVANNEKPGHGGHGKQRDGKGGFSIPRKAPPPHHKPTVTPTTFDGVPADIKLADLITGNDKCGELDLGNGQKIVFDCVTDDYSIVPGAAQSVVSASDLASLRGPRKLPALVDHRKDGSEAPILDQGKVPACTAFSLIGAADHAAFRYLGTPPDLSPMHAWARYHKTQMGLADQDNVGRGLTDLVTFPFDQKTAIDWMKGVARPDPVQLKQADGASIIEITNITRLDHANMTEIKSAIAAGQDVWFALRAAHGMVHTTKNKDGEAVVPNFDWKSTPNSQRGAHAIVLAGYQDSPHGTYYLVRNSWGPKWGTDGYAWIWEKTLRTNIMDAYVLQVRPTDLAHAKTVPTVHSYQTCSAGLSPDATTGECVPACPDKGPRVNGVCPVADQCPEGEVNLEGSCELAAPTFEKTLSNGVKVTCGTSGCTYAVPPGASGCLASAACAISCAAPRFLLGSGARGLTCDG